MTGLLHFQHYGLWSPPSARVMANPPRETMRDIIERVAGKHGVCVAYLIGPARFHWISRRRQEAMYECWQRQRWSLPQIGRAFNRDHTTVLHGVRAHERRAGL